MSKHHNEKFTDNAEFSTLWQSKNDSKAGFGIASSVTLSTEAFL